MANHQNKKVSDGHTPSEQNFPTQPGEAIGLVHKQRTAVLSYIAKNGSCCDAEIARGINLPANIVCARRNEMVQMGFLVKLGMAKSPITSKRVNTWGLVDPQVKPAYKPSTCSFLTSQRKRRLIIALCNKPEHKDSDLAKMVLGIYGGTVVG